MPNEKLNILSNRLMKLNKYLYEIIDKEPDRDMVTYTIILIPSCPIYDAHFPEMPITPGVCQIQIIKELLEDWTNRILEIQGVKNAKFVSVLKPDNQVIKVSLAKIIKDENQIKVQAVIADDDSTYAKLSLQTVIA